MSATYLAAMIVGGSIIAAVLSPVWPSRPRWRCCD